MKEYISLFETTASYNAAKDNLDLPNVAYCKEENEVHYNPIHDYADDYLTFVALESGTFTFTPQNSNVISYSTDGGETWTEGNSISVNNGDKVMWKGTMTPSSFNGIGKFSSTAEFDVQGNIMSLLYGDNHKGQTSLTGKDNVFYQLFYVNTKIVNAENLSLPATTLAKACYQGLFQFCSSLTTAPKLPAITLVNDCYNRMFSGCASLTTAPKLPATTLTNYCYYNMFSGCTNLNYVKCLATDISASNCTTGWLTVVSATGTFVKNSAATWTVTGTDGIPSGWTVETASE